MDKKIIFLLIIYFFLRLINLTAIPIFNDEAIYLDWGRREIAWHWNLYYSLFDGKQPFLMWIFGLSQFIFQDPLFAGRIISVISGFFTLTGIYMVAKIIYNRKIAFLSSLLYIIIPIFSFFDRQALMESAMSAIGVWLFYFYLNFIKNYKAKYAFFLGMLLGVGFFTKSNLLIFLISLILLNLIYFPKIKNKKEFAKNILIIIVVSQAILIPLYNQKLFWSTLKMNQRYSLTINEITKLPLDHWANMLINSLELMFWYLTPVIFLFGFMGIFKMIRSNGKAKKLVFWFILNILLLVLVARNISPRYIASFLPVFTIFTAYFMVYLFEFKKRFLLNIIFLSLLVPLFLTLIQIASYTDYFYTLNRLTKFSQKEEYVSGWTSGYGILDARDLVKKMANGKFSIVGVRSDSGNPENAVFTYFYNEKNIRTIYLYSKMFPPRAKEYNCIKSNVPIYFISRSNQLAGLDKFLLEIRKIYKPEGKEYIGVYKLNDRCKGKKFNYNIKVF